MNATKNSLKIAFFGTPEFSVIILDELKKAGYLPSLIITNPARPQGRDMVLASISRDLAEVASEALQGAR